VVSYSCICFQFGISTSVDSLCICPKLSFAGTSKFSFAHQVIAWTISSTFAMSRAIKVFIFLPHVLLHELHMRRLRSHGTLHNCSFISSFGCIIWQILGCVGGTKLGRGNGQKSRETIRDMSRVCLHSERGEGHWCGATCQTCNSPRYHDWKEISQ
jgi:hypothetical protein